MLGRWCIPARPCQRGSLIRSLVRFVAQIRLNENVEEVSPIESMSLERKRLSARMCEIDLCEFQSASPLIAQRTSMGSVRNVLGPHLTINGLVLQSRLLVGRALNSLDSHVKFLVFVNRRNAGVKNNLRVECRGRTGLIATEGGLDKNPKASMIFSRYHGTLNTQ